MDAPILDAMRRYGHKKVVLCNDNETGLRAVIAIHSTVLGPATGGLRMWTYPDETAAIMDALRLARGMTYKYAAAGVNLGGGKAVIIGDPKRDKNEAMMRAMGRFIDRQGGEYMTGEDVGTTLDDMELLHSETDHVVTLPEHCGGAGDISPATALGAIQATRACALRVWGSPDLTGRSVMVQGLGACGMKAARLLAEDGCDLVVSDLDDAKVAAAEREFGAQRCDPDAVFDQRVDIFAPYALGGVINDDSIARLKCRVVAGSANNILAEERHGEALEAKGIVYAVDYVANSGGTIFDTDRLRKGGFNRERAMANVRRIFERTQEIFAIADRDQIPFYRAADRMAEERIASIGHVRTL